ncbi:MBL fold metallo-hydrolase [Mycolicibacterium sp. 018/SC-01/001]|uniref:MBL fold metallo-hydrolase n=1 Tax=Mycolicibacterium sp. 018/SC-01/001 TaxID=2592069 RepID=UPI00117DE472|nr:MBL fold metallo-hydrolase [Mycolicibacterium sp. 018/SC-01/001]TRW77592.1 MBL fold metallo-hydrolase [Mycolicibacterium sp. 018/SC-01/001]
MSGALTLETFTAPPRRLDPRLDIPAPADGWTWPPTSVTLIAGEREAILIDALPTIYDGRALADWIDASGTVLTTIFITHGHLDHYLGATTLLERFPSARLVATEATVGHIAQEVASGAERAMYAAMFVDELPSTVVTPEALDTERLELEGKDVLVVATGQSDHVDSSYIHLPELDAVIVGDIAYNDVHCALMGSDHTMRRQWIATIEGVAARHPETVVAAHRREGAQDDARILSDTIAYLDDADRMLAEDPTAEEFVEQMLRRHPTRVNTSTLLFGAATLGLN